MPEQEKDEVRKFKIKVVNSLVESHESGRKFEDTGEVFDINDADKVQKYFMDYYADAIRMGLKDEIWNWALDVVEGSEPRPQLGEAEAGGMGR